MELFERVAEYLTLRKVPLEWLSRCCRGWLTSRFSEEMERGGGADVAQVLGSQLAADLPGHVLGQDPGTCQSLS
jgi:hypothetical protein